MPDAYYTDLFTSIYLIHYRVTSQEGWSWTAMIYYPKSHQWIRVSTIMKEQYFI